MLNRNHSSRFPSNDPEVRIGAAYEEDLPQVLELTVREFSDIITRDDVDFMANAIEATFMQGHITTLRIRNELVGFINGVELCDDLSESTSYYVQRKIKLSTTPERREEHFEEYQRRADKYGKGKVVVEYYESDFGLNVPPVQSDDFYLQTMVIDKRFRGQGFGHVMLDRFLYELKLLDGRRIFSDCLEGSGSEHLFKKHGFQPLARFGPTHQSGQSSLFVARYLNRPDAFEGIRYPEKL